MAPAKGSPGPSILRHSFERKRRALARRCSASDSGTRWARSSARGIRAALWWQKKEGRDAKALGYPLLVNDYSHDNRECRRDQGWNGALVDYGRDDRERGGGGHHAGHDRVGALDHDHDNHGRRKPVREHAPAGCLGRGVPPGPGTRS